MRHLDSGLDTRESRMRIPRSRGALSGFLLVLLGLWGALLPFVGPYFDVAYGPNTTWVWTTGRGWLEVLPGAATVLGGLLLLRSRNRATAMFGGWLTVVAGVWFVVGRLFAARLGLGDVGSPVSTTEAGRMALELIFFSGLGSLIIVLGGTAIGRLSVRSLRDIRYAQGPMDEYHRDDYARTLDRETIAHERAEAGTGQPPERRHRGLRDVVSGRRRHHPLPH